MCFSVLCFLKQVVQINANSVYLISNAHNVSTRVGLGNFTVALVGIAQRPSRPERHTIASKETVLNIPKAYTYWWILIHWRN